MWTYMCVFCASFRRKRLMNWRWLAGWNSNDAWTLTLLQELSPASHCTLGFFTWVLLTLSSHLQNIEDDLHWHLENEDDLYWHLIMCADMGCILSTFTLASHSRHWWSTVTLGGPNMHLLLIEHIDYQHLHRPTDWLNQPLIRLPRPINIH